LQVGLLEILCPEVVFEGEELFAVGGGGGEGGVVEGEEERVDVGDPAEARGLDAGSHRDSVGEFSGDVGAVEDVGGVGFALLLPRGLAGGF